MGTSLGKMENTEFLPPSVLHNTVIFLTFASISTIIYNNMQASEITHSLIQVSEDVAPLKSMSTHLRIATYDLIREHIHTICKYMYIHHLAGPWPFRKLQ